MMMMLLGRVKDFDWSTSMIHNICLDTFHKEAEKLFWKNNNNNNNIFFYTIKSSKKKERRLRRFVSSYTYIDINSRF